MTISGNTISGTLHYVSDYTGFSSDDEKNDGNFLALSFIAPDDAKVVVTFIGANETSSPVTLEPDDRDCVFRISDKSSQSVKVEFSLGDENKTTTYSLTGLTLDPAPTPTEPEE